MYGLDAVTMETHSMKLSTHCSWANLKATWSLEVCSDWLCRKLLARLNKQVNTFQDPLQFAYHPGVGVEDAIICLLRWAHCHLDKADSTERIMFFDFSSAFNKIQPELFCKKLEKIQVDASTITWITDCLTNKAQFVRMKGCVSEKVVSSTAAPQGTVLSLFLFTLHTSDFQYNWKSFQWWTKRWVQGTGKSFSCMVWEQSHHLEENKIIFFRRTKNKQTLCPSTCGDEGGWGLQIPGSFPGQQTGLEMQHKGCLQERTKQAVLLEETEVLRCLSKDFAYLLQVCGGVCNLICSICWDSSIRARNSNKLNKLIKKAGSVLGTAMEPMDHTWSHLPVFVGIILNTEELSWYIVWL